ncbi:MAG: hypothetical protein LBI19_06365 [Oscillospiraceae bacterium]|jgi:hypothetical protein|nr:hypothetical protein [Oscillospiraceae bacterium]
MRVKSIMALFLCVTLLLSSCVEATLNYRSLRDGQSDSAGNDAKVWTEDDTKKLAHAAYRQVADSLRFAPDKDARYSIDFYTTVITESEENYTSQDGYLAVVSEGGVEQLLYHNQIFSEISGREEYLLLDIEYDGKRLFYARDDMGSYIELLLGSRGVLFLDVDHYDESRPRSEVPTDMDTLLGELRERVVETVSLPSFQLESVKEAERFDPYGYEFYLTVDGSALRDYVWEVAGEVVKGAGGRRSDMTIHDVYIELEINDLGYMEYLSIDTSVDVNNSEGTTSIIIQAEFWATAHGPDIEIEVSY